MPTVSFVPEYAAYAQAGVDEGDGVLINMRVAVSMPAPGGAGADAADATGAAATVDGGASAVAKAKATGKTKGSGKGKGKKAAEPTVTEPASAGGESAPKPTAATAAGKAGTEPTEHRNAVAVAVAIDHSGSMHTLDRLPVALEASCFVVDDLTRGDALVVCAFDDTVKVLFDGPSVTPEAAAEAKAAINSIKPEGGTDIFGAALRCVQRLSARPDDGRGVFVILASDGQHNSGTTSQELVVRAAKSSGVRVYTIGIGSGHDAQTLSALARATGGVYVGITSPEGLASAVGGMLAVEQTMRASHATLHLTIPIPRPVPGSPAAVSVEYHPPGLARDGSGSSMRAGGARGADPADISVPRRRRASMDTDDDPAAPSDSGPGLLARAAAAAAGAVSAVAAAVRSTLLPTSAGAAAADPEGEPTDAAAAGGAGAAAGAAGGAEDVDTATPTMIGDARIVAIHTTFPFDVSPDGRNAAVRLGCLSEGESRELLVTVLADRVTAAALLASGAAVDASAGPAGVPALVNHVALAGRVEYRQHGPGAAGTPAGKAKELVRTRSSFLSVPRVATAAPAAAAAASAALVGEAALAAARARVAVGPVGIVGAKANAAALQAAVAGVPAAAATAAAGASPRRNRAFVDTRVRVRAGIVLEAAAAPEDEEDDAAEDVWARMAGPCAPRPYPHRRVSPGPAGFHTAVSKPSAAANSHAVPHAPKRLRLELAGGAPLPGITPDPTDVLTARAARAAAPSAAAAAAAAAAAPAAADPAAETASGAVGGAGAATTQDWRALSGRRLLEAAVSEMDRQDRVDATPEVFAAVRNDIEAAARDMRAARSGRGNGAAAASCAMMYGGQSACVTSVMASPATAIYATASVQARSATYRSRQTTGTVIAKK